MMMLRRPRVGLLVLMAATLSLHGATSPLNPLVTRTPQPTGPVPAECAEALAPAPMPRLDVTEIPLPLPAPIERAAVPPPPPTGSLRDALEAAQTALTRNDRPAFDASLASARELLRDYPSGAQRKSAEELVRIYETAGRLWDAQYESPFLDEGSAESAALRSYPGYENAVRRSTLTRDGRRWFPAGESRDFLGRIAAERLRGIGIQATAPRLARNERPGVPDTPRVMPAPHRSSVSSMSPRTTSRPRRTPSTTTAARTTRPPRSSAPSRPRLTAPVETRTPAPATSTPSTPNPSAPPTAVAAPEPAAPATGTTSAPATASPAAEAPAPEPVPTGTTVTTAPAVPEPAPAATPSRGRSVILPTILILIGLGVLILLFRASK